jgi:uncharacterized membrane protein
MAATSHGTNQASGNRQSMRYQEPTAWAGWVVFGGTLLILIGAFQVVQGLVAVFNDGFYLVSPKGLVLNVNYTTWGWTHVVIGIVALLAGLGLMAGNIVARTVGVIVAMVSAIVNMAFVAAYPVWSLMVIGLDVVVIYAIIAHGRELKD